MADLPDIPVTIRAYQPQDQVACRRLYLDGMVAGAKLAANDTGLDIDDIERAYAVDGGNGFWVAVNEVGEIVGMIGVQHLEEGVGEIRRLRVRADAQRRGIGSKLLVHAIAFCQEIGHLKVALGTSVGTLPAVKLLEKFHFRLNRSKTIAGKEMSYFYLDFYSRGADDGDRRKSG
ncbi:MAG TPA: GNAT family N-acetyltransferase [Tepidisphaeraceae bacterium]|nr:GNAT family N-acetyltransferase [Tepidisphaeraceae bacterium]